MQGYAARLWALKYVGSCRTMLYAVRICMDHTVQWKKKVNWVRMKYYDYEITSRYLFRQVISLSVLAGRYGELYESVWIEAMKASKTDFSPRTKEAISGISAGVFSTVVNHPLDLIKVRLQLDYSAKSQYESFKTIVKHLFITDPQQSAVKNFIRSTQNLYRGLAINLLGNAASWSLYFLLYNDIKSVSFTSKFLSSDARSANVNTTYNYMISSFIAGSITTLLTNPIWVLKTRLLSTNKDYPHAYKSILDGVVKIMKTEGPRTFFKGFTPGLVSVCQGSFYFTIYDSLKQYHVLDVRDDVKTGHKFTSFQYLYITTISKIVSTSVFYPAQLFKSRLQSYDFQLNDASSHSSTHHKLRTLIKETHANEGIRGFYKGLYINLFRTLPATCVTFLTYENMKNYL